MKVVCTLLMWVLHTASMTVVWAQSPRQQLQAMVEQLQKTPNDNALREKIITLAQDLKPGPAVIPAHYDEGEHL